MKQATAQAIFDTWSRIAREHHDVGVDLDGERLTELTLAAVRLPFGAHLGPDHVAAALAQIGGLHGVVPNTRPERIKRALARRKAAKKAQRRLADLDALDLEGQLDFVDCVRALSNDASDDDEHRPPRASSKPPRIYKPTETAPGESHPDGYVIPLSGGGMARLRPEGARYEFALANGPRTPGAGRLLFLLTVEEAEAIHALFGVYLARRATP